MPLPKRPTVASASQNARAKDERFASFETNPKFRLPSKKKAKTKLDPRFSRMRTDPDFQNKAPVDRYGRRVTGEEVKENLDRLYGSDGEESEEENLNTEKKLRKDKAVRKELAKAQSRGIDPIRDGGLSSSSEESSDEEKDDEEDEVEDQAELAGDGNQVPTGDVTARLAAVNMDWDNIRASDIMAVANSFLPADGRIRNVIIYPSEFGLERLQREELEGPPKEIFAASASAKTKDITDVDELEQAGSEEDDPANDELDKEEGDDFDSKALRTYQLDRLRYYYAVIECSSPNAAKSIYDNLDGREYLSSSNFFDLRFVPDGVDFDAEPHDQCEELPKDYKPNEFITGALSHSKVKLTWDADDTTRKEAQKRAFSRKEIDENELQAYLGNESSSSEDEAETSKADKAASLRAALGLAPSGKSSQVKSKPSSKRDRDFQKPAGEMEVTFTSGLSTEKSGPVFENEPDETTLEKYKRKQRERKEKRRQRNLAVQEGRDPDAEPVTKDDAANTASAAQDEDPWNDPFFASDPEIEKAAEAKFEKSKKAKKREEREKAEQDAAAERANLELLMVDDGPDSKVQHFDMNEVIKAERAKKKKKGKKSKDVAVAEDNFKMNTEDPRFAKLFESHEYAIDPTNPRFKETKGMKALLEEGRNKRKRNMEVDDEGEVKKNKKKERGDVDGEDSLSKLAARVKAKSKMH
ncbi:hypothetical protein P280DRAFT_465695 [Massarina eburnea CBS 473.64]|uniref:Uncharacterized protein n=1 Tax=Massarina eburnea CBS 473.64 TaxID=1395130 RepID=A0A6A6SIB3_9PLEO|nr:hypothetical protein P280DRAFT_465695 [Massarina eburnea CBS 473.64]